MGEFIIYAGLGMIALAAYSKFKREYGLYTWKRQMAKYQVNAARYDAGAKTFNASYNDGKWDV